jgi:hypothetical protein
LGYEHAYSPYNLPQNLGISETYQIPVGRGKAFLNQTSGFANAMVGGWQTKTIVIQRYRQRNTPI